MESNIKIHNHFDFYSQKENEERKYLGRAENMVLNKLHSSLFTYITGNTNFWYYTWFGKGVVEPEINTYKLGSALGYKPSITVEVKYAPDKSYIERTTMIELLPEEYVGQLITEVGVSPNSVVDSTHLYLMTHARIKDSVGNNISIEKKSNERLFIYSTIYIYMLEATGNSVPFTEKYTSFLSQPRSIAYSNMMSNPANYALPLNNFAEVLSAFPYETRNCIGTAALYVYSELYMQVGGLPEVTLNNNTNVQTANITTITAVTTAGQQRTCSSFISSNKLNTLDIYGYSVETSGVVVASGPINTVDVTAVALATSDGVKTSYVLPHIDNKNITVLVDGTVTPVTITTCQTEEKVNLVSPRDFELILADGTRFGADFIPYKAGYMVPFNRRQVGATLNIGATYLYELNGKAQLDYALLPIAWTGTIPDIANFFVYSLPDYSALIINYTVATIPKSRIYSYDAANGVIGTQLLGEIEGNLIASKNGAYLFNSMIKSPAYNSQITCYSFTRTSSLITLIPEFSVTPYAANYTSMISMPGRPFIDSYIRVGINRLIGQSGGEETLKRYVIDYTAKTFTLEQQTTQVSSENFAVKLTSASTMQVGKKQADKSYIWSSDITLPMLITATEINYTTINNVADNQDTIMIDVSSTFSGYIVSSLLKIKHYNGVYTIILGNPTINSYNNNGQIFLRDLGIAYVTIASKTFCITRILNSWRENITSMYKMNLGSSGLYNISKAESYNTIGVVRDKKLITFSNAPTNGKSITANYQLDYLPKDENWTIGIDTTFTWGRVGV